MKRAFDEGWGGVICKTLCLDSNRVKNVTPRYGRMKASDGQVIGWENIELISDRPIEVMLADMKQLKEEYPNRCDNLESYLNAGFQTGSKYDCGDLGNSIPLGNRQLPQSVSRVDRTQVRNAQF